jgi:AcrR family transcriptional regulator
MTGSIRQPALRSVPRQQRSRERYELVLDTAEALLAEHGYDAFTTTTVAAQAGFPPSTVYRWFADKDELAAALLLRNLDQLDEQSARRLDDLGDASLAEAVACVYDTYVDYYRSHPSHVILWFQGRIGRAAVAAVQEHTGHVAEFTLRYAIDRGLLPDSVTTADTRLMAEVVDRIHEYAFRIDPEGDVDILSRGLALAQQYYDNLRPPSRSAPSQIADDSAAR